MSSDVHDPTTPATPASPPPSFHSRASSPTSRRLLSSHDPLISDAERALADSFDSPSDDEDHADGGDEQRLIQGSPSSAQTGDAPTAQQTEIRRGLDRRVTQLPVFTPAPSTASRAVTRPTHDGVFANLSAKPERGEKDEEQPPSYEQAAADATPPYWENTILAPGIGSDEVFIDGLPVGSVFSFAWNALIAMSFQFVGFLLTYLLHTTHAAKNGSKAGLGIALVQWGFSMKTPGANDPDQPGQGQGGQLPSDPNGHDIGASTAAAAAAAVAAMIDGQDVSTIPNAGASGSRTAWSITSSDWIAYGVMILGWFILIKSISNFLKARRHEQLVLQSPDRGLGVAVVAEGERAETVV
ncbi:MAG: hypothetical protein M1816_004133 [Peltula sp. TS41687]|nr:MAG: hypothetical protein M1816_004133 [Peltula sp. TS41687]